MIHAYLLRGLPKRGAQQPDQTDLQRLDLVALLDQAGACPASSASCTCRSAFVIILTPSLDDLRDIRQQRRAAKLVETIVDLHFVRTLPSLNVVR